jgi:hypothetical protein
VGRVILQIVPYVAERRPTACSVACGQFLMANIFVSEILIISILSLQKCARSSVWMTHYIFVIPPRFWCS